MLEGLSGELLLVSFFALLTGFGIVRALLSSERTTPSSAEGSGSSNASEAENNEPSQWYEVLGVDASADLSSIKTAYKRRISQYHPDKVASLAPEYALIAEQRTKEINWAYETALKFVASRASNRS